LRLSWLFEEPEGRDRYRLVAIVAIWLAAGSLFAALTINYAWEKERSEMEKDLAEIEDLRQSVSESWQWLSDHGQLGEFLDWSYRQRNLSFTDEEWEYISAWPTWTKRFRTLQEALEEYD